MLKTFNEVFDDYTKYGTKIKTEQYHTIGSNVIIDQGQSDIAGYTDQTDGLFTDVPVIVFGDHTRIIKYINRPFFLGADGTKILKSKIPNANYKYLYYALKNAKIPNTGYNRHFKWLKQISISFPEHHKQSMIVEILDKLEDSIDNYNTILGLLDKLVKARFIEMFGRPFINNLNWESKQIKNVVNEVKYGTSKPSVENGEYKYLRMNNLTYDGRFDLTDLKFISLDNDELEKCVVRKGDVLFNRTNSLDLIGKTAEFDFNEDMVIAGYIIRIRLKETIVPKFFSMYMNTDEVKLHLRTIAKGAVNQANINAQELQGIPIYIPPIELQQQFADFVKQVDKSRFDIKKSIIELEREVVYD